MAFINTGSDRLNVQAPAATFPIVQPKPLSYLDPKLLVSDQGTPGLLQGLQVGGQLGKNAIDSASLGLAASTSLAETPLKLEKERQEIAESKARVPNIQAETAEHTEQAKAHRLTNQITEQLLGPTVDFQKQDMANKAQGGALSNIKVSGEIANQPNVAAQTQATTQDILANTNLSKLKGQDLELNLGINRSLLSGLTPGSAPSASPISQPFNASPPTITPQNQGPLSNVGAPAPAAPQPAAQPATQEAPMVHPVVPGLGIYKYNRAYLESQLKKGFVPTQFKLPNGMELPIDKGDGTFQSTFVYKPEEALKMQQTSPGGVQAKRFDVLNYGQAPTEADAEKARSAITSANNVLSGLDRMQSAIATGGQHFHANPLMAPETGKLDQIKAGIEGDMKNVYAMRGGVGGTNEGFYEDLIPQPTGLKENFFAGGSEATQIKIQGLRQNVMNRVNADFSANGLKIPYPTFTKEQDLATAIKSGQLKQGDYFFGPGKKPKQVTAQVIKALQATP